MANTYIKIFLHLVFAVKNREAMISPLHRNRIHSYMFAALHNKGQHPVRIGGTGDHVHILFAYNGKQPLPELVREIKSSTTNFINENRLCGYKFQWQKGYACFSHSRSQTDSVAAYIDNQNLHHRGMTLRDEIAGLLRRYEVDFKDEYLFENI